MSRRKENRRARKREKNKVISGRRKKEGDSNHHIIPTSRGGTSKLENIAVLTVPDHRNYHTLFSNKTPEEIIETLVTKYWKGNWDYVDNAYNNNNGFYRKSK